MVFDQEKINILKDELDEAKFVYLRCLEFAQKEEGNFLKTKLAFVAFFGLIFTISLDKNFSNYFLGIFSITILSTFLLLINDIWVVFSDYDYILKKLSRNAALCNIRHTAGLASKKKEYEDKQELFLKYGREAEQFAEKENKIIQFILEKKPIEEIIKYLTHNAKWKFNFLLWSILMMFVPLLFIFELFLWR